MARLTGTFGVDIIDEYNVDRFNVQIKDFISKLPGINSKNIYSILNKTDNPLEALLRWDIPINLLGMKEVFHRVLL